MKPDLSRRDFLTAGLVLPAAGLRATNNLPLPPEGSQARPEPVKLTYRTLGNTGLKVTSLTFGCIPDVLRFATDAEGYGQFALARERFLELPRPARDVRCRDCTSCSFRCAYGVAVRDRLTYAQEMLA